MASVVDSVPHTVRTAQDPRQSDLYDVILSRVEQVNSKIRLLRLSLPRDGLPFRHLPGQWLDVYIPSIPTAGGFTITSPPSTALVQPTQQPPLSPSGDSQPYVELAIQSSPSNPPAAYLWRPASDILFKPLKVRVGGKFIYPPPQLSFAECSRIDRAVFVAGGVGVNPVMSIVSAIHGQGMERVGGVPRWVTVLYSVRKTEGRRAEVLFYERLKGIAESYGKGVTAEVDFKFVMFETGPGQGGEGEEGGDGGLPREKRGRENVTDHPRRIGQDDLLKALGPEGGRANTVVYVCGPPKMTDEFVEVFRKAEGIDERRVLCEKWW